MNEILTYMPVLALTVFANLGLSRGGFEILTYTVLGLMNAIVLLAGLFVLSPQASTLLVDNGVEGSVALVGWCFIATAALALCALLPALRRRVAPALGVSPESPVDAMALVLGVDLVGFSAAQMILLPLLWDTATESLVTPERLWIQGFFFTLIGAAAVGFPFRRNAGEAGRRLGLTAPRPVHLLWVTGAVGAAIVLNLTTQLAWESLWPEAYRAFQLHVEELFAAFSTPAGILAVGVSAGIGEEILFRGALQPRLGLIPTTILFAVIHSYYGLTPAFLWIGVLGLGLGILRLKTNTTVCIIFHAVYNTMIFALGS